MQSMMPSQVRRAQLLYTVVIITFNIKFRVNHQKLNQWIIVDGSNWVCKVIDMMEDNGYIHWIVGFSQEFTVQPLNSKSPAIKLQTVPPVNGSQADKSKPKRIMKVTHPLKRIANSMRSNKNKSNANLPSTSTSSNPTGAFTPALTSLLALVSADVKASSSVNEQNTTALQEVLFISQHFLGAYNLNIPKNYKYKYCQS